MEGPAKFASLDPDLSRRLHRALTASKDELYEVLLDPSMEVLQAAVRNPSLAENHLLALLKRRDLSEDFLKALYRNRFVAESHGLKVAMVHNPGTPGQIILALLPHLYLFELVDICFLAGGTPDQKLAAERAIVQRLPTTPLGNKLTLARRGTSTVVEALLREGDSRLVEPCLDNPRLKESTIFQFLNSSKSTAETISMVARHPRWKGRPNLQLAILKNPRTPAVWFNLFLSHFGVADLQGIIASRRLTPAQKKLVTDELKRRGHG
ncbi:hypothetical protein [Geobacter sp. AOG1]|uniref:hypothetical protein n=1 Tax=Geobacter sp. AOG1 TaxID=1566346 RepID=UPI001CC75951|nr:hypothetical protein [Geobacter sp. AOG1]GFE57312.1 hypothetical protein AOG1_11920 [Geobacter sp. AOG1]